MNHDWNDTRLAREEYGASAGRKGQENTWGQKNKQKCGDDEVSWCECEFENKFDDDP